MELKESQEIYKVLISSQYKVLVNTLIKSAVRYSRLRVDWLLSDLEGRIEMDAERTRAHNTFIDNCNIVCRNMEQAGEDTQWRTKIGSDRKAIGDFACLINAVLSIEAR